MVADRSIATLETALDRLRAPTTAEDRFRILQQLVEYWHGPIGPQDAMQTSDLEYVPLPQPLRSWFLWAGNRPEIMTGQNFLLRPQEIRMEDDHLLFYLENQGVYQWATLLKGDDPAVFGRYDDGEPWQLEDVTLSEHLILACLFEAIMGAPYGASSAWINGDTLSQITSSLRPLAIGAWRWPGATRFYARNGVFMYAAEHVIGGETGHSVWIGAKTKAPLAFLRPHIDAKWEYVAL